MNSESPSRDYRQTARARAAEETGKRIIAAFQQAFETSWFDEIRLDDVAAEAGVTVQTVIRRFGGKEGLLAATEDQIEESILAERKLPVGDAGAAIDGIIAEYEVRGDMVMRMLAQEDRYAPIMAAAERGRRIHRQWVGQVFAPWLETMPEAARRDAHDRLVIALDLYVWKLQRRDLQRSVAELRATMLHMCASALGVSEDQLLAGRTAAAGEAR